MKMSPRLLKNHPILLAEATLDMSTALLKKTAGVDASKMAGKVYRFPYVMLHVWFSCQPWMLLWFAETLTAHILSR